MWSGGRGYVPRSLLLLVLGVCQSAPGVPEDEVVQLVKYLYGGNEDQVPAYGANSNLAFLFIKPHAANEQVRKLVERRLAEQGFAIERQGEISHDVIDQERLIDNHYGAIAMKATALKPHELSASAKAVKSFKEAFGLEWAEALEKQQVYNAMDAATKLGLDAATLDQRWSTLKRGVTVVKFGGGFYVGKIEGIFVVNGFYMAMRAKYTENPAKIAFYVVRWAPGRMSWADFRSEFIGPTDPSKAPSSSLRGEILAEWKSLGLEAQPDTGDNGIHASASPFEALVERINWVGADLQTDDFGKQVLGAGVPAYMMREFSQDPQIRYGGEKSSLFDLLEDLDARACAQKLGRVYAESPDELVRYLYGGQSAAPTRCAHDEDEAAGSLDDDDADSGKVQNQDRCTTEECISTALRELQQELQVDDKQLDDGLIGFGDDLIQYCMWQVRPPVSGETKGEAPPPLPATFSTAPAPALCKRVLFGGPSLASSALLASRS